MAKIDRSILQANDQSMGQYGDPDKIESSITHLADKIDENDNGFNSHKDAEELAHPDKSVSERKLRDLSVSRRTIQPGAVGSVELDDSLLDFYGDIGVKAKLDTHDTQLADIAINVKSFGAKGDGVTDDTTAIQNAINSLGLQGGRILFPKGDYLISSPITVGNISDPGARWNITLEGINPGGYEGTRILTQATDFSMVKIMTHGVQFKNLSFVGSGNVIRGADATVTAIEIGDGTIIPDDILVDNCFFFRLKRGVHSKTRNYYIKNSTFGHIQQYGIYMDGLAATTQANSGFGEDYNNRDIFITGNRFHGCYGDAIYARLTTIHKEVDISGNLIDDVARGIVGAFIRSKINDNILGRIRNHGIYIDNTGYDESVAVQDNVIVGISGNLAGDAVAPSTGAYNYETGDGIHVTSKGAKINNNTVMYKAHNGIWVGAGSEGTQVNDNTVINADNYNTTTYDAITNASNNVTFDGNIIKRTTSVGKHRHALNNSGAGCYFGAGNQYGASSGSKVFNDTTTSSVGFASNLGMYRKVLYGGANPAVTSNLQKGDRWINVLATNAGEVTEYQFNGTAWKSISTLGA